MNFKRFYRYDFAVTQVLNDLTSKYYGIVINAHILSYSPTSVFQILNETKKPFFIDPWTFVFARDLDTISKNGKIRKSYCKLIEDYGLPFSQCESGIQLIPSQFKNANGELDTAIISGICKTILQFQHSKLRVSTNFSKYDRILKKGITPHPVSPSFLVAPYFFANQHGDEWYNISLQFAKEARDLKGDEQLCPVICIASDVLWDETQISNIVQDYKGFDGYLIWVDNLDEKNISDFELKGLKSLISKLAAYDKPVYSLYGGFLFDLLRKFGLSGYSSGICYGERRSVDTKGGGAGNRYYVPTVHLKISEDLANLFFAESERNRNLMCSCSTCSEISSNILSSLNAKEYSDRFFTLMDFLDFRRHFVNVSYQESEALENMNNEQILAMLNNNIQTISNIDSFLGKPSELSPRHLRFWRTLFLR
jgi:hypothetical protein